MLDHSFQISRINQTDKLNAPLIYQGILVSHSVNYLGKSLSIFINVACPKENSLQTALTTLCEKGKSIVV